MDLEKISGALGGRWITESDGERLLPTQVATIVGVEDDEVVAAVIRGTPSHLEFVRIDVTNEIFYASKELCEAACGEQDGAPQS